VVDSNGADGIVVLIGTPTADSSRLYALTVTEGDPAWAGPLSGVRLNLPVFHITESEIKEQIDAELYAAEVGVTEMVIERDEISKAMNDVRSGTS
jgi:glycine/sarcosine/betaine reductase complex component A